MCLPNFLHSSLALTCLCSLLASWSYNLLQTAFRHLHEQESLVIAHIRNSLGPLPELTWTDYNLIATYNFVVPQSLLHLCSLHAAVLNHQYIQLKKE